MPSPELRDPTDPAEWLRRARSNLARAAAGRPSPDVLYEDLASLPWSEPVTEAECRRALELAQRVFGWAQAAVEASSGRDPGPLPEGDTSRG